MLSSMVRISFTAMLKMNGNPHKTETLSKNQNDRDCWIHETEKKSEKFIQKDNPYGMYKHILSSME